MRAGVAMAGGVLQGRHVQLEPLALSQLADLVMASQPAADTFRWYPVEMGSEAAMRDWIGQAVAEREAGTALPFAIRRLSDGALVGSTRYGAIVGAHARAEIGWSWLSADARRTPINTECKLLLLEHGFGPMGLNRVELKTDSLNAASRAAIARIGATQEGIFRNHMVVPGPRLRHTVWFSIVREEWPAVRARLQGMLASRVDTPAPSPDSAQVSKTESRSAPTSTGG